MRKYLRPAVSLATIGLFLLFALASFGPDGSTNTTVAIKDCKDTSAVSVTLKIDIKFKWRGLGGESVSGGTGRIFIVHQKVNPDECTYTVTDRIEVDFVTDVHGEYTYPVPTTWTHDNTQDLIRVEVYGYGSVVDNYEEYKDVTVRYYGDGYFYFRNELHEIL